jgi:hypothetical protein
VEIHRRSAAVGRKGAYGNGFLAIDKPAAIVSGTMGMARCATISRTEVRSAKPLRLHTSQTAVLAASGWEKSRQKRSLSALQLTKQVNPSVMSVEEWLC